MAKIEYPKWIYHSELPPYIVPDAAAHAAAGPDWYESPVDAQAAKASADLKSAGDAEALARIETEKREVWGSSVGALIERLDGCSLETLTKVKSYELENKSPRKSLIEALDKAIAAKQ